MNQYYNYKRWRLSQRGRFELENPSEMMTPQGMSYNSSFSNLKKIQEGSGTPLAKKDVEEGSYHIPEHVSITGDTREQTVTLGKKLKKLLEDIKFVLPPTQVKHSLRYPSFYARESFSNRGVVDEDVGDPNFSKFSHFNPYTRNQVLAAYVGSRVHNVLEHPNFIHPLLDKIQEENHTYSDKDIPKTSPFRDVPSKSSLSKVMGYYASRLYQKYLGEKEQIPNFLNYITNLKTDKSSESVRILHNMLVDILNGEHLRG